MEQVVLLILLYVVYITLPILPSYLIYKNFPDGAIGVRGILQSIKINATGAFAGYVIVCLLGYPIISTGVGLIKNLGDMSWEVVADVKLVDGRNSEIPVPDWRVIDRLFEVEIIPDKKYIRNNRINFYIPKYEEGMNIQMSVDGFIPSDRILDESVVVDRFNNIIHLGQITLKRIEQPYGQK